MEITKFEYQKKDPNWVNLYVDEEYLFPISVDTVAKESLRKGDTLSEIELKNLEAKEIPNLLKRKANKLLNRKIYTRFKLKQKLENYSYKKFQNSDFEVDSSTIESVLDDLVDTGLVNDLEYAKSFIRDRVRMKPRGFKLIKQELYKKGVNYKVSQRALDELDVKPESDMILELINKKYRKDTLQKGDQKEIRYLQSKGFSWNEISKVIE